jgi:hypothetical protein
LSSRKTHDVFVLEIQNKFNGKISVLGSYNGSDKKLMFSCLLHGDFNRIATDTLYSDFGCPKCGVLYAERANLNPYEECSFCGNTNNVKRWRNEIPLCSKHYDHMRLYGVIKIKTLKDKNEIVIYEKYAEIIMTDKELIERGRAIISLDKVEAVIDYKWYLSSNGYACSRSNGSKITLLHRLIMDAAEEDIIDHIDRDRLNCVNSNLRKCTSSQNSMNSPMRKNNTSGVMGVWRNNRIKKPWTAEIFVSGKKIRLGNYETLEEAKRDRLEAERKYFKEFAPNLEVEIKDEN